MTTARFDVSTMRQGNVAAKRVYTAECGDCGYKKGYETTKIDMPLQVVENFFKNGGWLLGKKQRDHKCPQCMGVGRANKLVDRGFRVTKDGQEIPRSREAVAARAEAIFKKREQAEEIVGRFFGPTKPDAAPPEQTPALPAPPSPTLLPSPTLSSEEPMAVQSIRVETGLSLEQTLELTRNLDGLSTSIKGLSTEMGDMRAAMEMVMEQNQQIINAIGLIIPQVVKSTDALTSTVGMAAERLANRLEETVSDIAGRIDATKESLSDAIKAIPEAIPQPPAPMPLPTPMQRAAVSESVRRLIDRAQAKLPLVDENPKPLPIRPKPSPVKSKAPEPVEPSPEPAPVTKAPAPMNEQVGSTITVASSQDSQNPQRFYTQIRMDRSLWESAGFDERTRPVIRRVGESVVITAGADKEGVKIKTVTPSRIVLQISTLGNAKSMLGPDVAVITKKGEIALYRRHAEAA